MKPGPGWERVKSLFEAASSLPPAARAAWLAEHCQDDAEVRQEVESLLAAGDAAPAFLENPAAEIMPELLAASPDGLNPGDMVGPYRLAARIGVGGMGSVWRAALADRPQEPVAVKVLWQGSETPSLLRRFANERQTLASLRHPNIARLLDGGLSAQSRPYLVMEFVDGTPLDRWCDERKLSLERRLEIMSAVCEGVHFAHRNLIVHRDLKPENILVTADGAPKLLDFGISKIIGGGETGANVTLTELRAMTPQYASPEQVRGDPVTTASDVYSLGVILYELLTGRRPYRVPPTLGIETQRVVTEVEPLRPSAAAAREPDPGDRLRGAGGTAAELAERRGRRADTLPRALDGDLDKIVMMAMRKDPARRYASAGHLGEEIRRFLHGLPVEAQEDTFGYRMQKFVRRNRLSVSAAGVVVLALVAGVIGTTWQARVAAQAAAYAKSEADSLHRIVDFLTSLYEEAADDHAGGRQTDAVKLLEESVREVRDVASLPNERDRAALLASMGQVYVRLGRFEEAEDMLQESMDVRVRLYPAGHVELAESKYRLAFLRRAQGRLPEAEALVRDALRTWSTAWGDTVDLARTQHLLGQILVSRGANAEAEQHLLEAERILLKQARLPRAIVEVRADLGRLLTAEGRFAEAEEILRAATLEAARLYPDSNRRVLAECRAALGAALRGLSRFAEAEQALREAIGIEEFLFGAGTPKAAAARAELGRVLFECKDWAGAEEELWRAGEGLRATPQADADLAAGAAARRARALLRLGRAAEARDLLTAARAAWAPLLPADHPALADLDAAAAEAAQAP